MGTSDAEYRSVAFAGWCCQARRNEIELLVRLSMRSCSVALDVEPPSSAASCEADDPVTAVVTDRPLAAASLAKGPSGYGVMSGNAVGIRANAALEYPKVGNSGYCIMKENIVVSDKGQVTLPAAMRKSLGLGKSTILTAEQISGQIVLTPTIVIETELYSDEEVAEWDRADAFEPGEYRAVSSQLKRRDG